MQLDRETTKSKHKTNQTKHTQKKKKKTNKKTSILDSKELDNLLYFIQY